MIAELHLPQGDNFRRVAGKINGFSTFAHYLFFESLLHHYPHHHRFLILGVFHGRDMAFLLEIASRTNRHGFELVGVDWFQDKASADWPAHLKDRNWEATGFGPVPTKAGSEANLVPFNLGRIPVEVVESEDKDYLRVAADLGKKFDIIYLDTAHDYETINRQLQQVRPLVHTGSIVCGDDYRDVPGWGVKRAVAEHFTDWKVWDGQIWYARATDFK